MLPRLTAVAEELAASGWPRQPTLGKATFYALGLAAPSRGYRRSKSTAVMLPTSPLKRH